MNRPDREPPELELPLETMRELGYRAVDALVDRYRTLPDDPAWKGGSRAEIDARMPLAERPRAAPRDPHEVLDRAVNQILPEAARIDHPRFFAFIPSAPVWGAVLGHVLATGFNVFQGTWLASAGPSRVEVQVTDWFRRWLEMPEGAGGVLTSGGSVANLMAVVMARELAGNPERPVVYLSDQGHASLRRGSRLAGIPAEGIRTLPTDDSLRISPAAVGRAIDEDRERGRTPILICANGGATNTGRVDPLDELADVARDRGVRLHVDAAYGGFAVLTDRGRRALAGIGRADTVTLDPHKWLFQPFECGGLMARDPAELVRVFGERADYLQDTELGDTQVNFGDRGVQLSRSFRALGIWMTLEMCGLDALRRGIAHGMDLAERAQGRIESSAELRLLSAASLGIVLYRWDPGGMAPGQVDRANRRIQEQIVQSGLAMVSSTRLDGRYALRLCILNFRTGWDDVEAVLERVEALGPVSATHA